MRRVTFVTKEDANSAASAGPTYSVTAQPSIAHVPRSFLVPFSGASTTGTPTASLAKTNSKATCATSTKEKQPPRRLVGRHCRRFNPRSKLRREQRADAQAVGLKCLLWGLVRGSKETGAVARAGFYFVSQSLLSYQFPNLRSYIS